MKISNEAKVGTLTVISLALLIFGYNFLRGRSVLKTGNFLYAKYTDAKSLMVSNPVYINGFQVGNVYDIETEDASLKNIIITIKLKDKYQIPDNSTATVKSSLLGTPSIEISLGNTKKYLESGDTINSIQSIGLIGDITSKIDPITTQLKFTLTNLDTVLHNINSVFSNNVKGNIASMVANMDSATKNIATATAALNMMLDKDHGSLTSTVNSISSVTKNLADNNNKVNTILSNVEATTQHFSQADVEGAVTKLKSSIEQLNLLMTKINSDKGSLGMLMNDKTLYNNLNSTVRSANTLLDDVRIHPKRYVNISVFGKKDKTGPIAKPVSDSLGTH